MKDVWGPDGPAPLLVAGYLGTGVEVKVCVDEDGLPSLVVLSSRVSSILLL